LRSEPKPTGDAVYNKALDTLVNNQENGKMLPTEPRQESFGTGGTIMPFGRYKGRTIGDVVSSKSGKEYLEWLAGEDNFRSPGLRAAVFAAIDGGRGEGWDNRVEAAPSWKDDEIPF
jgi:uncharacterized protein (DUF3820 family)